MRKITILVLTFVALSAGVFQACKKKEPVTPPVTGEPDPPSMAFTDGKYGNAYEKGDSLKLSMNVSTEQALQTLILKYTEGTKPTVTTEIPMSGQFYSFSMQDSVVPNLPPGQTIIYDFTAKDGAGRTTTAAYTITVITKGLTMIEVTGQGYVSHIDAALTGGLPGAFDLVGQGGVDKSEDSTTKDMVNITKSGSGVEPFVNGWRAFNTTRFVKSDAYHYDLRNFSGYINYAFDHGAAPAVEIKSVVVGDVYIARTPDSKVVLLKIVSVEANTNPAMEDGKISFTYKKY